jgi:hypothetical protein
LHCPQDASTIWDFGAAFFELACLVPEFCALAAKDKNRNAIAMIFFI